MQKPFNEVFNSLVLDDYMKNLVKDMSVFKVSVNKEKTKLSVYIISHIIVRKKDLFKLQELLTQKFKLAVDLYEKYELSSEYTAKQIFSAYKYDLAYDMKNYGVFIHKLFCDSKFEFVSDNDCVISVPKMHIYESRLEEFKEIIEKIFVKRFSIPIFISFKLIDTGISVRDTNLRMNLFIPTAKKNVYTEEKSKEEVKKQDKKVVTAASTNDEPKKQTPKFVVDNIDGEVTKICDIEEAPNLYIVDIMISNIDYKQLRNGSYIVIITFTDFTDSIRARLYVNELEIESALNTLKKGNFFRVKGKCDFSTYDNQEFMFTSGITFSVIESYLRSRIDRAPVKRVELCCHTKMSKMEAVCDISELIKLVNNWGHKAVAITDFGVVHGFPDAMHSAEKLENFKIIYGVSAYAVDDSTKIVSNSEYIKNDMDIVVFDIETTGFNAAYDKIIEIGATKIRNGEIIDEFQVFVNPERPLSYDIIELTKIYDEDLKDAETIDVVLPKFLDFCENSILVAHNASFDMSFINKNIADLGYDRKFAVMDTLALARNLIKNLKNHRLGTLAKYFGVSLVNAHRASDDARATAKVLLKLLNLAKERGCDSIEDINKILEFTNDDIKKLYPYNMTILAKNDIGRVNLYTLISKSHLEFFRVTPKIPFSLIDKHREGLIIGSGTIDGKLQQAVLRGANSCDIENIVKFYDYIEVQPPSHYIADEKQFTDKEMVYEHIKKIISIGEYYNIPVVATGNVHFIEAEDEIYRHIIKYGDKKKLHFNAPYNLMTTDEMLYEFSFLGEKKAYNIVVENSNKIADMIDNISPVRPDKCPPVIENSDKELRRLCYEKATAIYGENLPNEVKSRLERELNSIISNGFAVMYIIAQKLVSKSNEDGYMVGSRGSVGSSLAATMSGITEVNPLPAHYYCEKCHYSEFDSEIIREYQGLCGCDLPDKDCPICGNKLNKEGFNIPFETFLGFKGNKEPDIDLNFSGEYQSKAHQHTEVIFGKGQTFRAGTISGVADKTAFGYVRGYYDERNIKKRGCEYERLAQKIQGVKKTTGQHPGGIIVLPLGENINSFTPIQHPADDENSNIITTHFDYHSIDHNLLKLDILGHDDPTMIRHLEDLTGVDAKLIPFDEPKVMSIFHSPEALGVKPSDIRGCQLGCRGIPEFGTEFTIQMVMDTKPRNFSDLVKISGLSHGTNVWVGNAKDLIDSGTATIAECICTRDDIMTYLISQGLEPELAFTIMESVRKGKGLKSDWEEEMRSKNIQEWYINSCNKIAYMFPKAHAVAYVMMAYRIAYFKVYYPLEYYTAFFSIRASAFDYKRMCMGKAALEREIDEFERQKSAGTISNADKEILKNMYMVQEFYARGYEFTKIDIYKAKANDFQIIDGKIMPAFSVIASLGEKAAESVVLEAKKAAFLSKDDLKKRCKLSSSVIDKLTDFGILDELPDTNQISIYDFL